MNERIRELADKIWAEDAGIVFWEMSGDVDWRQANKENLEDFARLIIDECANIVRNDYESYNSSMQANNILVKFGVYK